MQIIKVDGVGELAFPDGMSDDEISQAIYSNFPELRPAAPKPSVREQQMAQTAAELEAAAGVPKLPDTSYDAMTGATPPIPQQYDTFLEATGKGLSNVPGRFQQSYAGLVKMVGEDMQGHRLQRIQDTSRRLGISEGDYLLLAWAGNNGLIDRKDPANQDTIGKVKQQMLGELTDEQLTEVMNMGIFNPDDIVNYSNDLIRKARAKASDVNAEPGSVAYYTSAAITSTAEMVPALVAGILTRNPQVSMGIIGAQVSGQQYEVGREKGLEPQKARQFAMASAAAEAIPEYLPLSKLLAPGTSFFRKAFDVTYTNAIQEMITESINIGLEAGFLDENTTWKEARSRIIDAGIIGSIAGPLMTGVSAPVQYGQAKVEQALAPSADQQFAQALQSQVDATQFNDPQAEAIRRLDPSQAQMEVAQQQQAEPVMPEAQQPQQVTPPAVQLDQPESLAQIVLKKLSERGALKDGYIPVVDPDAAPAATVEKVVEAEQQLNLDDTIIESDGRIVRVYGDIPTIRAKLQEAGFPFPGAEITSGPEAGLSFGAKQEAALRDALDKPAQQVEQPAIQEPETVAAPEQAPVQTEAEFWLEQMRVTGNQLAEQVAVTDARTEEKYDRAKREYEKAISQEKQKPAMETRLDDKQQSQRNEIEKRIANVQAEKSPESIKAKAEALGKVIRATKLPDDIKQDMAERLEAVTKEVLTNEPSQLDAGSRQAPERASTEKAPAVAERRPAAELPAERSRTDVPGAEPAGSPGVQPGRSVGDGARESSIPEARERGTQRAERPDDGGDAAAQPSIAERPISRGDSDQVEAQAKAAEQAEAPADNMRPEPAQARPQMFTITAETGIGQGGPKTKFKGNIEAIRILKQLQQENRQATPDEQAKLALFVGWGGLPQAFYGAKGKAAKGWEKETAELKELLTEAEYDAAIRSTQDAHYTSFEIVNAMWSAVRQFGFAGGKVLEPSVGSGNFIGLMPAGNRSKSQIVAAELDHITGGIAKQLYPGANIQAPKGFQEINLPDNHFDLAIGNPPFGSQKLYDGKRKDLSKFSIHNYFFAKSLDAVAPNGVLAMVVSNYLLDANSSTARQYLADRAELIGAIRLPNNAFAKNAGTEVTTDIIFLRKLRDGEKADQSWVKVGEHTDKNGKKSSLNSYFLTNPDMMLGEFGAYGSMYSPDAPALVARDGQDTNALLQQAIGKLPKAFMDKPGKPVKQDYEQVPNTLANVKVGSMFIQDGEIRIREEDNMAGMASTVVEFQSDKAKERVAGIIQLRDIFADLRKAQLTEGVSDKALDALRKKLNNAYDSFVKRNGPINLDANKRLFRDDPTWPQVSALEDGFDRGVSAAVAKRTGETVRAPSAKKAAIFTKRTQSPYKSPEKANTAVDALSASLSERGRVDMDYMVELYGKPPAAIEKELSDLLFESAPGEYQTRDEYLSGNVRKKLQQAEDLAVFDRKFARNVEALKAVQPRDIEAVDIDIKPGAPWLPESVMSGFASELLGTDARATYNPINASWNISGRPTTSAATEWGTSRVEAGAIIQAAANQKQIVVRDRIDENTTVVNEAATTAANEKIEKVKAKFREWIWADDSRRAKLSRLYNDTYNTNVKRDFDGSHLTFPGKVDTIKLRKHQADAVWRMMQSGTTLLDHVVGAGKTFTVIAGAMEMRRTGKAKKPMIVVPNHLVGQWAEDFMKLYPGANVLMATKKDFEKGNRKKLFARIATGDWDAVIVAHSSFGKVEMDADFQADFIRQQIRDIETAIQNIRDREGKKDQSVKQIEKQKERLQEKLKKLFDTQNKDDNLTFGELGVDALFLDEAHEFKNLGFATGMTRVAGLGNPVGSQKAADMFMKVQYVLKQTGGNNVVFATGTPISNTMAELYTMQRYLDYDTLQQQGIAHFDAWARMFGEVVTDWELSPSGNYKLNSRFAKFVNIPELMQRYLTFADVVNRDDVQLPTPNIKTGKPVNVVVDRSGDQAAFIGEPVTDEKGRESYPEGSLVWRSENLPKKPQKGDDNMLSIMGAARKAALDMRMIDPSYPDFPGSKINRSVSEIMRLYKQYESVKGAQLVFIDLSTPKAAKAKEQAALRELIEQADNGDEAAQAKLDRMSPDELAALDGEFSVYDDIKQKLIAKGLPESEVAFIHDANTELQKDELFAKVKSGRVRVLLGSTAKMGAGMNVQERLVALHHLDAPWRPSDLEQREGRIIRQGNVLAFNADGKPNPNFEIEILRYATKNTLDSRMWQTIEAKARFIEQVRKGNTQDRSIEDVGGEAANAAEMKAASSGNPLILEEMDIRQKMRKIEQLQSEHNREQFSIRDSIVRIEKAIPATESDIALARKDAAVSLPAEFVITIDGKAYDKRKDAGEALKAAIKSAKNGDSLGNYAGFDLAVQIAQLTDAVTIEISKAGDYSISVQDPANADAGGLITRITNVVKGIPDTVQRMEMELANSKAQLPKLKKQLKEFPQQGELGKLKSRHALIINELKPKSKDQETVDGTSAMMLNMGADTPMPKWQPTYMQLGIPNRPAGDTFKLGDREVKLPDVDNPRDRKGIRYRVEQIIGTTVYNGKVKGKSKLGFYRHNNGEVRIANYDNVEVLAHEMAHYLDFHYSFAGRFTSSYNDKAMKKQVEQLSYTSDSKLKAKEGFAEYVRLWLTQYSEAQSRAPEYTVKFEAVLAQDPKLNKRMRNLQEEMHKYYLQGAHAQLRANQGDRVSPAETVMKMINDLPASMLRQRTIDRIHAAKVVERTLYGDINDATASAYKMFQMINGAESVHEAVMKDGTPGLKADGTFEFTGKGLNDVFWPVAKKGATEFNLLMDYFAARRAAELTRQNRERLFTPEQIQAGLKLADTRPDFKKVFDEFQAFNGRMLDFYVSMGLLTADQRTSFAEMNKNYVPFQRIVERMEQGEYANVSKIGQRLKGGEQNVRDIAANIVEGLQANIKAAMVARAKNQLFTDIINNEDGAMFAAKLAPDSKLVKADLEQTAKNMADVLVEMGMTVSKDGQIIAGDPAAADVVDVAEIASTLASNPKLLTFWTFGHKPRTSETYVDSAVIGGKRVWFEVRSPIVIDMLTSMGGVNAGVVMKTIFTVKNVQTRLITSMLQFLGPNAVRDTVSATLISKNKFIPIYTTLEGMGHFLFNTDTYKQFRLQGGAFGTRIEARTAEMRSRRQLDLPSRSLWDLSAKALAGWDRAASLFEYGSRVGDYSRAIAGGKNAMQAAWEAREVSTDFAKMGSGEAWSMYLRTVPFMNAGLQGVDKSVREIMEIKGEMKGANLTKLHAEKNAFLLKGAVVTAATVLLWIINSDDERYLGLTADEKARFWWIFPPGLDKPVKIPRPYDIGHIFATIPEVALDYVAKRDGKEAAKVLAWTAVNTMGIGDYPGFLQPVMEALKNETFTGSPIIPQNLQNVSPQYQFTDRTPAIYRALGEKLNVSPLLAQHYAKGYFRYLEAYIADASEAMLWKSDEWGERPFDRKGPIDYFGQQFIGRKVPYRTKWTEGYYELRQRAMTAKGDFAVLQREAQRDDRLLKEFASKGINQSMIALDGAFRQMDAAFADQTAIIASYKYNKSMSKAEKEAAIDRYYEQKNRALRQFYEQARVEIEKIEKAMRK
ncbi:LPD38 domain-containing protein [Arsukibacterium sp.]|uniref:LPD38 domain-containing protein n=1 Tax=Arsukibacterium sp. TaxID=1977258 RepID=UPI002FDADDC0